MLLTPSSALGLIVFSGWYPTSDSSDVTSHQRCCFFPLNQNISFCRAVQCRKTIISNRLAEFPAHRLYFIVGSKVYLVTHLSNFSNCLREQFYLHSVYRWMIPPPPRSYFKSSASPGLSISYFCCLSRELLIPRSDTVQLHHLAPQLVIVLWLLKSWTCSQWRAVCTKLTEVSERSRDFLGQLQSKVMASLCSMRQTVPYAVSLFIYKLSNSTLDILFWLL